MAAAAANANPMAGGNLALTLEPHYSGRHDTTCTAERFLRSINSQRATNGWDDARTIAQAQKYLTGTAEVYFLTSLRLSNPERYARSQRDWDEWQLAFKEKFYSVSSTGDVSTQWARLHQNTNEDVFEFWARVTLHIEAYMDYFPAAPNPFLGAPAFNVAPAALVPFREAVVAELPAADAAAGIAAPDLPDAAIIRVCKPIWDNSAAAAALAGWKAALATNAMVLTRKVFIAGLKDPAFRNVARRMEMDGKDNDDIVDALTARERNNKTTVLDNKPIKPPPRPAINHISGVSAPEHVAAVSRPARGRPFRRGRGQNRGGRGSRPTRPAFEDEYPRTPGAVCDFCGFTNHTYAQCRKRLAPPKDNAPAHVAALSQLTEDSFPGNEYAA